MRVIGITECVAVVNDKVVGLNEFIVNAALHGITCTTGPKSYHKYDKYAFCYSFHSNHFMKSYQFSGLSESFLAFQPVVLEPLAYGLVVCFEQAVGQQD